MPERLHTGTIVHYVLHDGPNKGLCRPAIVTDHSRTGQVEWANLSIFCDGLLDLLAQSAGPPIYARAVTPTTKPGELRTFHRLGQLDVCEDR